MIKFGENKREQTWELVRYKDVKVGIANLAIVENDNHYLFKNNVKYAWARFTQVSKLTNGLMIIFFINSDLVLM